MCSSSTRPAVGSNFTGMGEGLQGTDWIIRLRYMAIKRPLSYSLPTLALICFVESWEAGLYKRNARVMQGCFFANHKLEKSCSYGIILTYLSTCRAGRLLCIFDESFANEKTKATVRPRSSFCHVDQIGETATFEFLNFAGPKLLFCVEIHLKR